MKVICINDSQAAIYIKQINGSSEMLIFRILGAGSTKIIMYTFPS